MQNENGIERLERAERNIERLVEISATQNEVTSRLAELHEASIRRSADSDRRISGAIIAVSAAVDATDARNAEREKAIIATVEKVNGKADQANESISGWKNRLSGGAAVVVFVSAAIVWIFQTFGSHVTLR